MKNIKKVILIFLLLLVYIKPCYASAGLNVPIVSAGSSGSGGSNGPPSKTLTYGGDAGSSITYSCYFEYEIKASYGLTIDGFNQENKSIISGDITPKEKITAGTAIGISIIETKSISWQVTNTTLTKSQKETTTTYRCRVKNINCINSCPLTFIKGKCDNDCEPYVWQEFNYWVNNTCKKTGEETKSVPLAPNADEKAVCESKAKEWVKSQVGGWVEIPTYEVRIKNSNYINPAEKENEEEIVKIIDNPSKSCWGGSTSKTCTFSYSPKTVCINLKTSKITYTDAENCDSDSIQVKNENGHWHYFTPLDAKSTDDFYLSIVNSSQSELQSAEFCRAAIDYNSNYVDLIKDKNYKKLSGDKAKDKSIVSEGCLLGTDLKIPVTQKFYNEEQNNNNQIIFKGFNFYYRAIDINNPFPNGIATDSYWYEWGQSQKANQNPNPDLSESFANKTYITKNISASAVREYNEEHPYTSWDEMNINGSSSLINSNKINNTLIERIGNNKDYYKLGCGPANKDWEECR